MKTRELTSRSFPFIILFFFTFYWNFEKINKEAYALLFVNLLYNSAKKIFCNFASKWEICVNKGEDL